MSQQKGPVIAWFGGGEASSWRGHERLSSLHVEWLHGPSSPQVWAQLHVVECCDAEQLRRVAGDFFANPTPVLYLVPEALVEDGMALLRYEDDLCLLDSPAVILSFRLSRLLHNISDVQRRQYARSSRDSLTGLYNRKFFFAQLERALRSALSRQEHSLLYIDIDHFKRINDWYGHGLGDEILCLLAERLAEACPTKSVLARAGGEEFWVLLPVGQGEACAIADELLCAVRARPFCAEHNGGAGIPITISVGIASSVGRRSTAEELIHAADECLYAAKSRGRNCSVHADLLQQEALDKGSRPEIEAFENITKVLTERIGEVIAWRGRRLFEQVREQADLDSLTGLYSRRYFDRRLPFDFEQASQGSIPLTLALLDVDYFGMVNKQYGWPTGDQVLADVAKRIKANVRADDWVARYGGEEICIVMKYCTISQAEGALERIRRAIAEEPFSSTDGQALQVTVSIGAAMRQPDEERVEALLERTSQRLLMAKRGGRNRLEVPR